MVESKESQFQNTGHVADMKREWYPAARLPKEIMIVAIIASAASALAAFSDVPVNHPYADAIVFTESQAIVSGYEDGTFRPDNTINRAEFMKIVMEANGAEAKGSGCFPDVGNEWFAPYVCGGKELGIVGGYPDGTFKPAQQISFVEAAKIISVANTLNGESALPAAQGGPWYDIYVRYLQANDAIPKTVNTFEKSVTRGEMVEMIYELKRDKSTQDPAQEHPIAEELNAMLAGEGGVGSLTVTYDDIAGRWGGTKLIFNGSGLIEKYVSKNGEEPELVANTIISDEDTMEIVRILSDIGAWRQETPFRAARPDETKAFLEIDLVSADSSIWEWFNDLKSTNRIGRVAAALEAHLAAE